MIKKKFISPHYLEEHFPTIRSIDDKILIFADRIQGWQLAFAKKCVRMKHGDFAALTIVFSYFEMIGKCSKEGLGPTAAFREGFRNIFF